MARTRSRTGPRKRRRKSRKKLAGAKVWATTFERQLDEGWDAATAARAADHAELRMIKKLPKPER